MTWRERLQQAREQGYDVLDWLSATDQPLTITACLIRSEDPSSVMLLKAPAPVASVADMFPSAAWHERETAELFDVVFEGSVGDPLFRAGAQLRKEAPLTARLDRRWPGAVDPAKPRRSQRPPGTPWP